MADRSFRALNVWQVAMSLVEDVYRVTALFPSDERFGLTAQIRRAAVSIPSNIAEGKRRKRDRVYVYHLEVALGSQAEVDVQLEIAQRVGFLPRAEHRRLAARVDEIGRMLNGLISSIEPRA
jgi:four helix bundle protein